MHVTIGRMSRTALLWGNMPAGNYPLFFFFLFIILIKSFLYTCFHFQIQEFGVTTQRELKLNGKNIPVTEENKREYVKLVCQERMTGQCGLMHFRLKFLLKNRRNFGV